MKKKLTLGIGITIAVSVLIILSIGAISAANTGTDNCTGNTTTMMSQNETNNNMMGNNSMMNGVNSKVKQIPYSFIFIK